MSAFSDRPFAAGSLIGVRAFDVDALGRLTGPTYKTVFTPGENEATCGGDGDAFAQHLHRIQRDMRQMRTALTFGGRSLSQEATTTTERPHVTAGVDCSCGFYAYFDGSNDYAQADRVTAIIEGYGVCTVGTRGFRAEKARLVALVVPRRGARQHPRWFDRMADRADKGSWAPAAGIASLMAGIAVATTSIALASEVSAWFLLGLMLALSLVVFTGVIIRADFHGIDRAYPSIRDLRRCHDHGTKNGAPPIDVVLRNYPDVPVYGSTQEAIAAHPLTQPPMPSPDEPDFWTRSAS